MPRNKIKQTYAYKEDLIQLSEMVEIKVKSPKLYKDILKIYDHYEGKIELNLTDHVDGILSQLFSMSNSLSNTEVLIPLSFLNTQLGIFLLQAKVMGRPKFVMGVADVLKMINAAPNIKKPYTRMSVYAWADKGELISYQTEEKGKYFYESDVIEFMKMRKFI